MLSAAVVIGALRDKAFSRKFHLYHAEHPGMGELWLTIPPTQIIQRWDLSLKSHPKELGLEFATLELVVFWMNFVICKRF